MEGVEPPSCSTNLTHNSHFSGANFFKKALESRTNKTNSQKSYRTLGSPEVHRVVLVCSLYHTALNTLTQLQLDILTGKHFHYFICVRFIILLIICRFVLPRKGTL